MSEQPNNLLKCTNCGQVGELWLPDPQAYLCAACTRAFRIGQANPEVEGILLAELSVAARFKMLAGRNCPYCLSPLIKAAVNLHNDRYSCPVLEFGCHQCGQQWNNPVSLGAFILLPPFDEGGNGHAALPVPG